MIILSFVLIILYRGDFDRDAYKGIDFSDSDDDGGKSRGTSVKKARAKECPGCGAMVGISTKQCGSCDYLFTSKSMLLLNSSVTAADESKSIRDRFPFEPERVSYF